MTGVHNGDHFIYIPVMEVGKLPSELDIAGCKSRVFKPPTMTVCKQCGDLGHCPSDKKCLVKSIKVIAETLETFRGGKCQLSNLHACPEGCTILDRGTAFHTSEHHYQFKKLKDHDMGEEAYMLLSKEIGFDAMKRVKSLLLDSELSSEWKDKAYQEMQESCRLKFTSYPHVREKLLSSKLTIVEATGDPFWGSGLNIQQTLDCLLDYWPGQNNLGKILIDL